MMMEIDEDSVNGIVTVKDVKNLACPKSDRGRLNKEKIEKEK